MLYRPTINLLPDNKKTRIKTLVRFIFARNLLEMSILFYALLAMVFIWSWLTLLDEYNNTAGSSTLVNRENSARNRQVRTINGTLKQFNRAAENYQPLSPLLKDVAEMLPNDIKLNQLILDRGQNKITILGTAKTREALLNYEQLVKNLPWLSGANTPVSQLLEKENINFEINATLKLTASK